MILSSLLNENFTGEAIDVEAIISEHFTPNSTGIQSILLEAQGEEHRLEEAVMLVEQATLALNFKGNTERAEQLSESMASDYFTKFVNMLKKMWAKVKGWFVNIFKHFETATRDINKLIEKYRKELDSKDYSNYEYNGHKWTQSADKVHEGIAATATKINSSIAIGTKGADNWVNGKTGGANVDRETPKRKANAAEMREKNETAHKEQLVPTTVWIKALVDGTTNPSHDGDGMSASEAKTAIGEKVKGGEKAEAIKNFSAVALSTMIDFLKNFKNNKTITAARKDVDKLFATTIKEAEQVRKDIQAHANSLSGDKVGGRDAAAGKLAHAKHNLDDAKNVLSAYTTLVGICIDVEKEKFAEFKGAIAGAIRHSGK